VGASVGVDGGALPAAQATFGASVGVALRRFRAELFGLARLPSDATAQNDPVAGGRIGLWALGVRGCGVLLGTPRRVELPLCLGFETGQVFAEGFGFEGARSDRVPWVAPAFAPRFIYRPIPRLGLIVSAEIGLPLNRASLVIEGLETVHQVGPVFGRGGVGIEGRFP
jgi:hypothetical protein